jgi:hypothetical protein
MLEHVVLGVVVFYALVVTVMWRWADSEQEELDGLLRMYGKHPAPVRCCGAGGGEGGGRCGGGA